MVPTGFEFKNKFKRPILNWEYGASKHNFRDHLALSGFYGQYHIGRLHFFRTLFLVPILGQDDQVAQVNCLLLECETEPTALLLHLDSDDHAIHCCHASTIILNGTQLEVEYASHCYRDSLTLNGTQLKLKLIIKLQHNVKMYNLTKSSH